MYQFSNLPIVAKKWHWLGSLDSIPPQNLEWGICPAGKERQGVEGEGGVEGVNRWRNRRRKYKETSHELFGCLQSLPVDEIA